MTKFLDELVGYANNSGVLLWENTDTNRRTLIRDGDKIPGMPESIKATPMRYEGKIVGVSLSECNQEAMDAIVKHYKINAMSVGISSGKLYFEFEDVMSNMIN